MVAKYKEDRVSLATLMRTYTRGKEDGEKESWSDVIERVVSGLESFGGLTKEELEEISQNLSERSRVGHRVW